MKLKRLQYNGRNYSQTCLINTVSDILAGNSDWDDINSKVIKEEVSWIN